MNTIKTATLVGLALMATALVSCEKIFPGAPVDAEVLEGTIPGLTPYQERDHLIGDEFFGKVFTKEEGLGPVFVQTACANCHVGNGKGHPTNVFTRFAQVDLATDSIIDHLYHKGGPQLQNRSIDDYPVEELPAEANAMSQRMAPVVMGLGFIAALEDQTILDLAAAQVGGVAGRPNYVYPTDFFIPEDMHQAMDGKYIGRFGKKAEKVTIQDQVVLASRKKLGIPPILIWKMYTTTK